MEESRAIEIVSPRNLAKDGTLLLSEPETIRIEVPELAEAEQANQFYEILYFVDGRYVEEAPIDTPVVEYELDPRKFTPEAHVLTVNASLGNGRIGTANLNVLVP